jgi:hypothetical protein
VKLHKMFAIALACLTVGSVLVSSGRADMVTVYSNDFQTSAGSEWFYPSIVSAPLPEDGNGAPRTGGGTTIALVWFLRSERWNHTA